jgi:hypothetical protein
VSSEEKLAYSRAAEIANRRLFKYAVLAQRHFGHLICKSNLHATLCPLPAQLALRGHSFYFTEFWLEQLVQWAKRMTKFRTTGCPEKLIMGCIQMKMALGRCSVESARNLTMGGLIDEQRLVPRSSDYAGTNLDTNHVGVAGLLGSGTVVVSASELAEGKSALLTYVMVFFPDSPWSEREIDEAHFMRYTRVQLEGGEIIHSSGYGRAISRVSCYVGCRYQEEDRHGVDHEVHYVGHVRYFLKVTPPATCLQRGWPVLRLAITDLYAAECFKWQVGDIIYAHGMCGRRPKPTHRAYPVALHMVDGKLVPCLGGELKNLPGGRRVAFVPYSHVPSALE